MKKIYIQKEKPSPLSVLKISQNKNLKRRARDPETGKNYVLPKNMTHEEWYDKYVGASVDKMLRKNKNIGHFKDLEEPMQLKHIRKVCRDANIDLTGIKIKIQRDESMLKTMYVGSADPKEVGRIDLFPNAFINREELLRTVVHEKVHVEQYQKHGSMYVMENRGLFEKEAEEFEEEWYNNFINKKGGKLK